MNTRLYSLFDKKVKTYGRVDVFTCDAVAIRCYLRYLQDDALHFNDFVSFPEDFNLVCVGEFNHDKLEDIEPRCINLSPKKFAETFNSFTKF